MLLTEIVNRGFKSIRGLKKCSIIYCYNNWYIVEPGSLLVEPGDFRRSAPDQSSAHLGQVKLVIPCKLNGYTFLLFLLEFFLGRQIPEFIVFFSVRRTFTQKRSALKEKNLLLSQMLKERICS